MSAAPKRPPITRRPPPKVPRHPDAELIHQALQRLTASPDWAVFIEFEKAKLFERWQQIAPDDAGALFENAVRKTFIRELERLDKRVTDDDRREHE